MRKLIVGMLLTLFSTAALADNSGLTRLTRNADGMVEIPISGSEAAYWAVLNNCSLVLDGHAKPGATIHYRPLKYGDRFFVQQYAGKASSYVATLVSLRVLGAARGCGDLNEKSRLEIASALNRDVSKEQIASMIVAVYDEMQARDAAFTWDLMLAEFPLVSGQTCPATVARLAPDRAALAACIDESLMRARILEVKALLDKPEMPPLLPNATVVSYAVRKQFSNFTIKTSFGFAPSEHTAMTSAYVSVYPTAEFIKSEKWSIADRFSVDIGIAKPTGDSAREGFDSADALYLFGLGFDLTESFSVHVADLMWFEDGDSNHDFMFGISYDVLSLFSKLNQ